METEKLVSNRSTLKIQIISEDQCRIEARCDSKNSRNSKVQISSNFINEESSTSNLVNNSGSLNFSKSISNLSFQTVRISKNSLAGSLALGSSVNFAKESTSFKNVSELDFKTVFPSYYTNIGERNMNMDSIILQEGSRSDKSIQSNQSIQSLRKDSQSVEDEQNNISQTSIIYVNPEKKAKAIDRSIFHTPSSICNFYQASNEVTPNKNLIETGKTFKLNMKNLNFININNVSSNSQSNNEENYENENVVYSSRNNLHLFEKKTPIKYVKSQLRSGEGDNNNISNKINRSSSSRGAPSPFVNIFKINSKTIDGSLSAIAREINKTFNRSECETEERNFSESQSQSQKESDATTFIPVLDRKNLNYAFNQIKEINNNNNCINNVFIQNTSSIKSLQIISNEESSTISNKNISIKAPLKNENFSFDISGNTNNFIMGNLKDSSLNLNEQNNQNNQTNQNSTQRISKTNIISNEDLINKLSINLMKFNIHPDLKSLLKKSDSTSRVEYIQKSSEKILNTSNKSSKIIKNTSFIEHEKESKSVNIRNFPIDRNNSQASLSKIPNSINIRNKTTDEYIQFIRNNQGSSKDTSSVSKGRNTIYLTEGSDKDKFNLSSHNKTSPKVNSNLKVTGTTMPSSTSNKSKVSSSSYKKLIKTHHIMDNLSDFDLKMKETVGKGLNIKSENKIDFNKIIIQPRNNSNLIFNRTSSVDAKRKSSLNSENKPNKFVEIFKLYNNKIPSNNNNNIISPVFNKKKIYSNLQGQSFISHSSKGRSLSRGSSHSRTIEVTMKMDQKSQNKVNNSKLKNYENFEKEKLTNISNLSNGTNNTILNVKNNRKDSPKWNHIKEEIQRTSPFSHRLLINNYHTSNNKILHSNSKTNVGKIIKVNKENKENKENKDKKGKHEEKIISNIKNILENRKENNDDKLIKDKPNYNLNTTVTKTNSLGKEILKRLNIDYNNITAITIDSNNTTAINNNKCKYKKVSSYGDTNTNSAVSQQKNNPKIINNFSNYTKKVNWGPKQNKQKFITNITNSEKNNGNKKPLLNYIPMRTNEAKERENNYLNTTSTVNSYLITAPSYSKIGMKKPVVSSKLNYLVGDEDSVLMDE